jgi:hypothetical protein
LAVEDGMMVVRYDDDEVELAMESAAVQDKMRLLG